MVELIIEDGSIVPNANTYLSLEEFKQESASYFIIDADATDDDISRNILRATRFIEGVRFKGEKVDPLHTMSWPRKDVCFAPYTMWPEDKVPVAVRRAVMLLCIGVFEEGDEVLTPPQNIRREKVGQLEAEFYSNGGVGTESVWQQQAIDSLKGYTDYMRLVRA